MLTFVSASSSECIVFYFYDDTLYSVFKKELEEGWHLLRLSVANYAIRFNKPTDTFDIIKNRECLDNNIKEEALPLLGITEFIHSYSTTQKVISDEELVIFKLKYA